MTKKSETTDETKENRSADANQRDKSPPSHERTRSYFRRLRLRLQVWLLIGYALPLGLLVVYFQFQFDFHLKKSAKLQLTTLAESKRNTIDLFLQERVLDLFNLFQSQGLDPSPTPDEMQRYLQNLSRASDAFVDVGFFDREGLQCGYAGPFPYLQGRDYSEETWAKQLLEEERDFLISDIYLGFRRKPHFTIAAKHLLGGQQYMMRATIDPDKFFLFQHNIHKGKVADWALVNQQGTYQIVDPSRARPLTQSDYIPPRSLPAGAEEIVQEGSTVLVSYAWLKEVPWAIIIRQPLQAAYAEMYRIRRMIIAVTGLLLLLIISATIITTNRLLGQAQRIQESRRELQSQLFQASKLVAVGELAAGVAHEINNPLAIIAAGSGLVRDMLDPDIPLDYSPEEVREELDKIDTAVYRARNITQSLMKFVSRGEGTPVATNVHMILDEILDGVKMREFQVSNIEVERNYDPAMPEILLDPDQIRQVFLNLINNAGDAIEGAGKISLSTRHDDGVVEVAITDTGKGMTTEQMGKIFLPFHTTKEVGKGTGLGLSVSLSIVEAMGGRIEMQSMPGMGSSFTVILPARRPEQVASEE